MTTPRPRLRGTVLSGQLSQLDLLLVAIPLALAAGVGITYLVSAPLFVGVSTGSVLAASLVGYSIYVLTRVDPDGRSTQPHGRANRIE